MEDLKRTTRASEPVDNVWKMIPARSSELTDEGNVQVESILRIIDDTINKIKISLILPQIFKNPTLLREYLSDTNFTQCAEDLDVYLLLKQKQTKEPPPHLNIKLIKLIDSFHENHEIINLLPSTLTELKEGDQSILDALHVLYDIAKDRFRKSAVSELNKEKTIHDLYQENERMKTNIKNFRNKLKNQKISLRWKTAAKDVLIHKTEEDLAFKKWDNNIRIKEEIEKSSRRIRTVHIASTLKQKELEEELEKARLYYEKVVKDFVYKEKEARDEKNKILLQLQSLNKKYDHDIGEKIKENMYLKDYYEKRKEEYDLFMIDFVREEAVYIDVVVTVREEERRKHEQRVETFRRNHAARVLQKYWRKYMKRLKARRKAEKSKSKAKKGAKKADEGSAAKNVKKGKKK